MTAAGGGSSLPPAMPPPPEPLRFDTRPPPAGGGRGRRRPASVLRRDLARMTKDGAAFGWMVGLGETYVPAFALVLGLGDVVAGLIASIPLVGGAVLQLVSPWAVRRLGSYRRWVVLCARVQAVTLLALAAGALFHRMGAPLLFAVTTLYWAGGMGTGPAWNAWVGAVVPERLHARYFARRSRVAQASVLAGLLAGGALLHAGEAAGRTHLAFAAVFFLAAASRAISAGCLARQSEPEPPPVSVEARAFRAPGAAADEGSGDGRLLLYLLAVQMAVYVAAPYFTPYMIGPLGLSYGGYVGLIAASFLAKLVMLPTLGGLARRFGGRRVLLLGGSGIVPLAALWTLSRAYPYLLAVQLLSGTAWAAHELGAFLLVFETIPPERRTRLLTLFNLGSALAMVAGSAAGAVVLSHFGVGARAYAMLFLISSGVRFVTLPLLRRVPDLRGTLITPALRPLAARPGAGSIDRPVLASLSDDPRSVPGKARDKSLSW